MADRKKNLDGGQKKKTQMADRKKKLDGGQEKKVFDRQKEIHYGRTGRVFY